MKGISLHWLPGARSDAKQDKTLNNMLIELTNYVRDMSYNIRFDFQNSYDEGDNEITTRGWYHTFYL